MASSSSIYDKLLELPLFQGHSKEDLTYILTKIKVDFRTYHRGQTLTRQDDPCRELFFLMEGELRTERTSQRKDLIFVEYYNSPTTFGIETIFGLRQNYNQSIIASAESKIFVVDKYAIINYLFHFDVFRYNMLNALTTRIQQTERLLWMTTEESIEQAFIQLCKRNFTRPAGYKIIEGGMVSLAHTMNRSRIQVSNMLNSFENNGLVKLNRKKIIMPRLEKLIASI